MRLRVRQDGGDIVPRPAELAAEAGARCVLMAKRSPDRRARTILRPLEVREEGSKRRAWQPKRKSLGSSGRAPHSLLHLPLAARRGLGFAHPCFPMADDELHA
jgi:hypothetical protein